MKIFLITKNFNLGGAEAHVCELANTLVKFGHEVVLISRDGKQKNKLNPKVRHYIWKINDIRYFSNVYRIKNMVLKEKFDVIHAHQRIAISMAALVGKLTSTPVIATVHGQVKYDLRSRVTRKRVTKVICVRDTSFQEALACNLIKDKSVLILNGVPNYTEVKQKAPYTMMYGSRIDKRHAWVLLLLISKALPELRQKYPKVKLVIWGDGKEKESLEKAITEANLLHENLVEYKGYANNLGAEYKSASLALACARSAMDALVAGTCLLPVNFHHLGDLVDQNNYELLKANNFEAKGFPKPDEDSLVQKIINFFENQEHYQEQLELLRDKIANDLMLEGSVKKIEAEYLKLIEVACEA